MKNLVLVLIAIMAVTFSSCENNLIMKSEKSLNNDLQGSWVPIRYTSNYGNTYYNQHIWKFENNSLDIINVVDNSQFDSGIYSIDSKIENPTLQISGLTTHLLDTAYGFNIKWTIVQLNDGILDIAGKPFDGGLVELEFQKK